MANTRSGCSFTLIELLVTIAVIAILAALLMPALARGKQRAKRVYCAGNLHQIGAGVHLFLGDYGKYFGPEWPELGGKLLATWMYGGTQGVLSLYSLPPEQRPLNPYIGANVRVFSCPTTIRLTPGTRYEIHGTDYPFNGEGNTGDGDGLYGIKDDAVLQPVLTIFNGDHSPMHAYWGGDCQPPAPGPFWHHPTKPLGNMLFCDGHVSFTLMTTGFAGKDFKFRWY